MEKSEKIAKSETLKGEIADVPALVLVEYSGLTVEAADDLRNRFRDAGCTYRVYKNSTVKYAVKDTGHEGLMPLLKGVTGLAYNAEDPGAPARVARDFVKNNDKLAVKGGIIDGQLLDAAGCNQLADMPGPRELKAKLLSLFNTPATNMVKVLQAPLRDFILVLKAKQDQGEAA